MQSAVYRYTRSIRWGWNLLSWNGPFVTRRDGRQSSRQRTKRKKMRPLHQENCSSHTTRRLFSHGLAQLLSTKPVRRSTERLPAVVCTVERCTPIVVIVIISGNFLAEISWFGSQHFSGHHYKVSAFWDVTPCGLVDADQCCLSLHGRGGKLIVNRGRWQVLPQLLCLFTKVHGVTYQKLVKLMIWLDLLMSVVILIEQFCNCIKSA